jgi:glucose-1-phosphate thymidylyltransferase
MTWKGILLAGGRGTRLYPLTAMANKQLQPIYNKPMIYYSLTTLMVAGIREILLITGPESVEQYKKLLGDGAAWGIQIQYAIQDQPRGIAEAFLIGESFLGQDPCMLMLGDNLIYGRLDFLRQAMQDHHEDSATIFAYQVSNPRDYGVVEFGQDQRVLSLEEKPQKPRSNWAVPGLYLYSGGVASYAHSLAPSARGELEITDLNRLYLDKQRLLAKPMGRGIAWLDTGTPESLLAASSFVHAAETRQGLIIGSPEEVALRMGFVDAQGFRDAVARLPGCPYRAYLEGLVEP